MQGLLGNNCYCLSNKTKRYLFMQLVYQEFLCAEQVSYSRVVLSLFSENMKSQVGVRCLCTQPTYFSLCHGVVGFMVYKQKIFDDLCILLFFLLTQFSTSILYSCVGCCVHFYFPFSSFVCFNHTVFSSFSYSLYILKSFSDGHCREGIQRRWAFETTKGALYK